MWCCRATEIAFDRLGFIPGYLILIVAGGGLVAYNGTAALALAFSHMPKLLHTVERTQVQLDVHPSHIGSWACFPDAKRSTNSTSTAEPTQIFWPILCCHHLLPCFPVSIAMPLPGVQDLCLRCRPRTCMALRARQRTGSSTPSLHREVGTYDAADTVAPCIQAILLLQAMSCPLPKTLIGFSVVHFIARCSLRAP